MKSRFIKREYPVDLANSEMRKVKFSNVKLKSIENNHNNEGHTISC